MKKGLIEIFELLIIDIQQRHKAHKFWGMCSCLFQMKMDGIITKDEHDLMEAYFVKYGMWEGSVNRFWWPACKPKPRITWCKIQLIELKKYDYEGRN